MLSRPLFGDLHNHNAEGYGKGSLERSYELARGALLDAYAFTPHGWWPDPPDKDPAVREKHFHGFAKPEQNWPIIQAKANAENQDGRFTVLVAFEWHSMQWGDYHVLYPGAEGSICRAANLEELQAFVRQHNAIMIPHHLGYRQGWRGANWSTYRNDVSPVVDIFSEHGSSMEADSNLPMILHSTGGSERSQTVMERLRRGLVAGLVASTDNHFGHPASYSEGLAGIWTDAHTRAGVMDAIRRRHTFAVTGDRIALRFFLDDAMMGDIVPSATPRRLRWSVDAMGPVQTVAVVKNGQVAFNGPTRSARSADGAWLVRLEFGWDGMNSKEVTDWKVRVGLGGGEVKDVYPCFAGGAGSSEKFNRILSAGPREVMLESFTSRLNSRHTSSVVLRIQGDPSARIDVDAQAQYKGQACGCSLRSTVGELREADSYGVVNEMDYGAPRIALRHLTPQDEARFDGQWVDPDPKPDDWYLLRVQQLNGQTAWSSPIWCRD